MVRSIIKLAKALGIGDSTARKLVHDPKYARAIIRYGVKTRMYDVEMFQELSRGGK